MISFKDDGDKQEHYIFPEEPGKLEIETSYPRGTVPAKVLAFVVVVYQSAPMPLAYLTEDPVVA
jgi:hypothetical protein